MLFRGYVKTKNKKCIDKYKDVPASQLRTLSQVEGLPEYAGVLADDTILIDIDDAEQAEVMMKMVESMELDCKVICTTRGKHFLFQNKERRVSQCYTHIHLACGLIADIKVGCRNSYEVLKYNGEERFCEWDSVDGKTYQEIPPYFIPVRSEIDFFALKEGEGRNNTLFSYELVLQSAGLSVEESKETIRLINKFVLPDKLGENELETIIRDEAFRKPLFFQGKSFQHHVFGDYIKSRHHLKRINGVLHIYDDGIYVSGYKFIEKKMVEELPIIKAVQRAETLKYLEVITPENTPQADPRLVAFRNCIVKLMPGEDPVRYEFTPDLVMINRIPWDYNPDAYDAITDHTLDRIACQDPEIRALLEECIGYCFYRENAFQKAFILTGQGSNGKSTYLEMVENVLGRENYVSLDLDELSERFSTSSMFGKLANIGDDISDDFLQGKQVAQFKKIVSGNDIKGEDKGKDIYFFRPTVKLLFSANEIPRVRNKGLEAVKRRLVIIPFDARFSETDRDYDPGITWKVQTREAAEYLVKLGLDGLLRVLYSKSFTASGKVQQRVDEFERDNNPVLLFLDEVPRDEIVNQETRSVFLRYDVFCVENGFSKMTATAFSRKLREYMDIDIKVIRKGRKTARIFTEIKENDR